jgi:retron-type reverse transcriptase
MQGLERLGVIQELSRKDSKWKHTDLFKILRKEDIWIAASETILGVIKETRNGIRMTRLRKLQFQVLDESYKFSMISKTSNDKIVQEVIRMVLESIYQPIFDPQSFGFVHDALQHVEREFRSMDWVIEVDMKNSYKTFDHNRLFEIIRERIDDPRFMKLIRKSLKGEGFLPIYETIYFNELDEWVRQKVGLIFESNSKIRNPESKKIEYSINKLSKEAQDLRKTNQDQKELVKKIKKLIQLRNQTHFFLDSGIDSRYARYADKWIIGIRGPNYIAIEIKNELKNFLKFHLNQELHLQKTKITNLRAGKVSFLGYYIFLARNIKIDKSKKKRSKKTMRSSQPTLRFQMPLDQVIKRMKERGYIIYDKNNKVRPISKASYSQLEDALIVNHFRILWLGLKNFYSGSSNRSELQYIHYLLHISCAMTLAHRHRSSVKKIMKKHGKRLEIMDKTLSPSKKITAFPYQTKWKVADRKWQCARLFLYIQTEFLSHA